MCNKELKVGISFKPNGKTYGRYGDDKFLKLKQHGYDAADYCIADTDIDLYSLGETELKEKMHKEKELAKLAGIEISQIHGPWRWAPQDSTVEQRMERLEKMKKSVIIASLLGCENVVVHPIMPYGIEDIGTDKEKETWDMNIDFFKELTTFAKQYSVTICLENMPMPAFSIATPEQVLKLVKTINEDNLKMCLDTGHVAIFPELSIGDEVRRLNDYIKVIHVHDNTGKLDLHMHPTKGIINWPDFINALYEIGYNGVFSLESELHGDYDDERFEAESINLCQMVKNLIQTTIK